jgi:hypothetical protein
MIRMRPVIEEFAPDHGDELADVSALYLRIK